MTSEKKWVVACVLPTGEVRFLVDRTIIPRQRYWTNRSFQARIFTSLFEAKEKAQSFTYNQPHVLSLEDATKISIMQHYARKSAKEDSHVEHK